MDTLQTEDFDNTPEENNICQDFEMLLFFMVFFMVLVWQWLRNKVEILPLLFLSYSALLKSQVNPMFIFTVKPFNFNLRMLDYLILWYLWKAMGIPDDIQQTYTGLA